MKKHTMLVLAAILILAAIPRVEAADLFLDATSAFDMTTTAACPLNSHTVDAPAADGGKIWTRDCDQTVTEGFVIPFSWETGMPTSGTVQIDAWIHTADGTTGSNVSVCTDVAIACRNLNVGNTTETANMTAGAASRRTDIVSPGGAQALVNRFATVAVPSTAKVQARCELRVKRFNTDGSCADDWAADALYEKFTLSW